MTSDWSMIVFGAEDRSKLELTPGWILRDGARKGDLVLAKEDEQ